ncbi:tRNA preQ1(34) S-adenosylmethionine ribosyltransferase-isomerase QueA [candidate division WOR-3 bacterium JGI_Cruoil_03_51_56]|uniref:S-adenosylmethionine:tRNA ribosyltransferase-isomerase n=1 Tax=candidate division WOR-3 bacterium JGI_Cruoil_03_51_56 TaxID=1973747 RepID=A0A235BRA0_UNCW3|nr:MAG: tRNA preQ1(34) S-adenosylmethionine ribosyltransferase-isomerase QueA [candidate division WOR-3 bacterium JGI_Cruoil_03_51_56]
MLVSDFDYELPRELIAQHPTPRRDMSRLLVLERGTGRLHDCVFTDIREWLSPNDLLVINNTRVIPARIYGRLPTGGKLEFLLLREVNPGVWEALSRPARKARPGVVVSFGDYKAEVLERKPAGMRVVEFEPADVRRLFREQGELALPPYIREKCEEPERYQTVFAEVDGAVAAPTAGLHFTPGFIDALKKDGVEFVTVTLHTGLGTFRPVKAETVEGHTMHPEEFELSRDAAENLNAGLAHGKRVMCVGTTSVRVVENQAEKTRDGWHIRKGKGNTGLYIYPGYEWRVTGAILTNFHLPKSTLIMLVSAFAGREHIMAAYRHAIEAHYRFYSFGDAMLIV